MERYQASVATERRGPLLVDIVNSRHPISKWVVDFIHESKGLLTLRRKLTVFRYAADLGYRTVRRKEGITLDLAEIDLERWDAFEYYSERHLDRTHDFVDHLLEQADAGTLRDDLDDGKQAFVDRLRADQ